MILGADAAAGILTWERCDEVRDLATIVAVGRPGAAPAAAPAGGGGPRSRSRASRCPARTCALGPRMAARSTTSSPTRWRTGSRPTSSTGTSDDRADEEQVRPTGGSHFVASERRPSRRWMIVFSTLLTVALVAGAVLAYVGVETVRTSRAGKSVSTVSDPTQPGFEAFLEPTPTLLLIHSAGNAADLRGGAHAQLGRRRGFGPGGAPGHAPGLPAAPTRSVVWPPSSSHRRRW